MDKARILVVEDEAIIATDLQWRLESMGYDVPHVSATGEEAIERARECKPDLVLMDIMLLGEIDGIEAANRIRSFDDIPIIYLTAYADEEILERAKITDPFGYLIKPVGDKELHSSIEMSLSKHRTDKKLKENEKWLSTVLSSIGDAVITTDTGGGVLSMNPAAESLTGWKCKDAIGRPIEEVFNIVNEETPGANNHPFKAVVRDKITVSMANHITLITRAGKRVPVASNTAPIRDEKGNIAGVVLVFSDITKRKQAEDALRKSEEQVRMLLNSTAEAIYGVDTENRCTFCNPSGLKLLGYKSEDDLLGKNMHKLIHHTRINGKPYPVKECRIFEVFKKGEGLHADDEVLWRADGSSFYAEYRAYPVRKDGKIMGAVVTFLDISKRREAEKFIKNILESVGEGFIVMDRDYRILSANKAYCTQVKQSLNDIIGKHCYEVSHHIGIPCYKAGEECPVNRTFETGNPHIVVHTHYDKDNNPSYSEIKSYAMKDESGEIVSVIETVNDLTEKRKLEAQLRQAQKMEAVGHLAGGVAHDFNNILTAIVGYASLLKMKMREEDPLRHNVNQILFSAERAANLTQSLLAFSRKQIMNPRPVNFNTIIESVSTLLKRLIGEDIKLNTSLTKRELIVMADRGQIEQVLMNLATNARDAMPEGGTLTIESERVELDYDYVATHAFGKAGTFALISVTDTGIGMDEKTRGMIFEPFFTTKEVGKGTGLGLATTYGIIKQHNGYINVYSEPGVGTTFKIYLPLVETGVEEPKPVIMTPALGGTETILLAEDDEAARTLTKAVLEEFGYSVIQAVDGDDAIVKFGRNGDEIKLVILDVIMPKKSGREVYEEIIKSKPDIKVLFTSGYTAEIIHKKGVLEEELNFLSKPFSPQEVLKKVREVLDSG